MTDRFFPLHRTKLPFRLFLRSLRVQYPFLRITELGHSVLGRPIYALQIGEPRERVLFCGAFHGMEWLTCSLLLRFVARLCHALDTGEPLAEIDVRRALLGRGLVVVPCVNPDGVEISLHGRMPHWNCAKVCFQFPAVTPTIGRQTHAA